MSQPKTSLSPSTHLVILVSIVTALWAYWPGWVSLLHAWQSDPDYNHGFLVLPISAWLLWQRRSDLALLTPSPSWWGMVLVAAAGVCNWLGAEFFFDSISTLSIPIWIAGVVLLFGGWPLLKLSAGPIAFLWFMTPLPGTVALSLSLPLQEMSAVLSTWTLNVFGQPAFRQGTLIFLGDEVLNVERACSGLRISYGITALAFAYITLSRLTMLRAIVLLSAAIPVAILANSARVTLTGLLFLVVSGEKAHQYVHDFAGLLMLPVIVGIFWMIHGITEKLVESFGESRAKGSVLIFKSGVVIAIAATTLGLWQSRQSEAAVVSLLSAAERHEIAGEKFLAAAENDDAFAQWQKAAMFLERYCEMCPGDPAAAERLAEAAERIAYNTSGLLRAARLYERAWTLNPDDTDIGLSMVRLALGGEDFEMACSGADKLLLKTKQGSPQHLQAFRLKYLAQIQDAERINSKTTWDKVATTLDQGIEQGLDPVECAYRLAVVYFHHPVEASEARLEETDAEQVLAKLIASRPDDPMAWLCRYTFHQRFPSGAPANTQAVDAAANSPDGDLDRAIDLATANLNSETHRVWLAAGERSIAGKQYEDATKHFLTAMQVNDKDFRAYLYLARLETRPVTGNARRQGVPVEERMSAIRLLKQGLSRQADPDSILPLQLELVQQQLRSGEVQEVAEANQEIRELMGKFRAMPREKGVPLQLELALLESRILADAGDMAKAARTLESMLQSQDVKEMQAETELRSEALLALGEYYEQQGLNIKAAACFQQGVTLSPTSIGATLHKAIVADRKNNVSAAAELYADVASRVEDRPEPWVALARSELRKQLRQAKSLRDFARLKKAVAKAKELEAPVDVIAVLDSESLAAEGDSEQALVTLEKAVALMPDSTELWRRVAMRRQMKGDVSGADAALSRFMAVANDSVQTAIVHSELFLQRKDSDGARRVLDDAQLAAANLDDQRKLQTQRLQIEFLNNNIEAIQRLLEQFAQEHPDDVASHVELAEYYWERQLFDMMAGTEQVLRRLEGENGTFWRELRARRLIDQALQSQDEKIRGELLQEAKAIAAALRDMAGKSASTNVLLGRLALQEERFSEAAKHFEAAWNEGINTVSLAADLITSLRAAGDRNRLESYLREIQFFVSISPRLFDIALAADSKIGIAEPEQAGQTVRGWAQSIGDSDSYLRLARTMSQISEQVEPQRTQSLDFIESAYRKSIELAPGSAEARGEFLLFLVRERNDVSRMQTELKLFLNTAEISELDRTFVTAQLLTQINLWQQASRYWNETVKLAKQVSDKSLGSRAFSGAISFFAARDQQRAAAIAREAVEFDSANNQNRRLLIAILSEINTASTLKEASKLLDSLKPINNSATDIDKRIVASVMFRRATLLPKEFNAANDLQQASQLLNSLEKPLEVDSAQLARIAGDLGDRQGALLALSDLSRRSGASVAGIRAFVEYWQDHFADTTVLSDRLQQAFQMLEQSAGREIVALDLQLRPGNFSPEETYDVTVQFVRKVVATKPTAETQDELLRKTFELLARRNLPDLSLRLLTEDIPPLTNKQKLISLMATTIQEVGSASFEVSFIDQLASQISATGDTDIDRLAADYFFFRAKWVEAEQCYRRSLEKDPNDVAVYNNLALVVAEHRKEFSEADRLIQTGLEIMAKSNDTSGESNLRDTQAQLLLAKGDSEQAHTILTSLSQSPMADVSVFLHLAESLRQMNRMEESKIAFATTRQMGISVNLLPPIDKTIYDRLLVVHPQEVLED